MSAGPRADGVRVLFWDIDGTLLSTARAGVFALEDAAEAVLGRRPDFSKLETAGLPDHGIAVKALEHEEAEATEEAVERFVTVYESRLPERLPMRTGEVMPRVREVLGVLDGRDDVLNTLLTGNVRGGALAKLRHYGLDGYFDLDDGAFSEDLSEREVIAGRAYERASRRLGYEPDPETVYVIGDTPHDVRCGKAIGVRTVAVATGSYDLAALEATDPWWAIERLPDAGELTERLGLRPGG